MKWEVEEEEIIVKFYLNHVNDWHSHIDDLMKYLSEAGFQNRSRASAIMRVSNVSSLHTGVGLSNASKQTRQIYDKLK